MIYDFHIDTMLDGSETLYFKLPVTDTKAEWLVEDYGLQVDSRRFYITQVELVRTGPTLYYSVEASAIWARLSDIVIPGNLQLTALTTAEGLDAILAYASGFLPLWTGDATTTAVDATELYSYDGTDKSILLALREWANITGTFLHFDTLQCVVELRSSRGMDRGQPFRYRKNLESILRRSTPPQATQLYPYGRDDLTIAGINGNAYVEDFTWYTNQGISLADARQRYTKRRVASDASIVDEVALLAWGNRVLAEVSQGVISYEAKVIDLSGKNDLDLADLAALKVGDTCGVRDEGLGIDVSTTLVRTDFYPLDPASNRVELASLPEAVLSSSAGSRSGTSEGRLLSQDGSPYLLLRNDAIWTTMRIPLTFANGGDAVFGTDIRVVGVGTGTLSVSAVDATADVLLRPALEIPYTDGEVIRDGFTWSDDELVGSYDYRIRMQAISTVTDPASGADLAVDESWFWILSLGATRQSPVAENSETFEFVRDLVQTWTVPDNVTGPITITCMGGSGSGTLRGNGSTVTAKFASVTPGYTYDVYVGGGANDSGNGTAGWPNGGAGGTKTSAGTAGGAGGGASYVTLGGGTIADALVVAGGGGGDGTSAGGGGDSAFFTAEAGSSGSTGNGGGGATQYAGGAGGTGAGGTGLDGTFGQGGAGGAGASLLGDGGGGGGGGWYGGGGGGGNSATAGTGNGSGGGGTGWIKADGYDPVISDANNASTSGQIIISWETPDL